MTAEKKKGGLRKYVAYGTGFLGDALYYQFISSYLLVFLTGAVGMNPKDAGTVGSIIVLADAAGSLFVGRFTDGLKCRYGRRRPVLLFSAFVLPLLFCLLFITVPGADPQRVVYYTATGLLFYLFFILYFVSQTAFGADSPASCSSSKAVSRPRISNTVGKGTFSLLSMTASSSRVGSISWWKVAIAT